MAYSFLSTPLGIIGYALTVMGFIARSMEGFLTFNKSIIFGMVLVSVGYLVLLYSRLKKLREEAEDLEYAKAEGFSVEEAREKLDEERKKVLFNSEKLSKMGYGIVATYFTLILVFPQITFNVRYYDIFLAIGYWLLAIRSWIQEYIPMFVGLVLVIAYYICGSYAKLEKTNVIDKLQLVSRSILAVYYGLYLLGVY